MPKQISEISVFSWFYYKVIVTMHGHINVKYPQFISSISLYIFLTYL